MKNMSVAERDRYICEQLRPRANKAIAGYIKKLDQQIMYWLSNKMSEGIWLTHSNEPLIIAQINGALQHIINDFWYEHNDVIQSYCNQGHVKYLMLSDLYYKIEINNASISLMRSPDIHYYLTEKFL